jgi:hypothetical protein
MFAIYAFVSKGEARRLSPLGLRSALRASLTNFLDTSVA